MSIKKHLNFHEFLYKKKGKTPIDFLMDEIDVESYFFHKFLDVYVVQKRVLRLSKGLFRETYSSKSLLVIHILRVKASNLRLNYTSQGKKFCLFSRTWK